MCRLQAVPVECRCSCGIALRKRCDDDGGVVVVVSLSWGSFFLLCFDDCCWCLI